MATDSQTPPTPQSPPQAAPPVIRQQYQPPEGAISIARLKRVGLAFGLLVLGYFTIWGSCHRQQPAAGEKKKPTAQVWPMSPANIDSQQAELDREMEEAKRAAEQAEFAKRRAQNTFDADAHPIPDRLQPAPVLQLADAARGL
jgi:hypothetical protein